MHELDFQCMLAQPSENSSSVHELVQLAFAHGASTRLRNSLIAGQDAGALDGISIEAVLTGAPTAIAALKRLPNFGAKTMDELAALVRTASNLTAKPRIGNGLNILPASSSPTSSHSEIPLICALDALNYIDERSRQVIERRLGLNDCEQQTLASVGVSLELTRERVRQIESKVLKQLGRMFGHTFAQILKKKEPSTLASLANSSLIPDTEEGTLFSSLSPEVRLLVRTLYKNSRAWLDTAATKVENGWILNSFSIEEYSNARKFLARRLNEVRLPCQLCHVIPKNSTYVETIVEMIRVENHLKVTDGYLLPRRSTRRPQRAVRVHKIMLARQFADPIPLSDLKETYHKAYPDDQCSARDLMIVLTANPQLFLNQYEVGWLSIGARQVISSTSDTSQVELPSQASDEDAIDEDDALANDSDTLRSTLAQILLTHGPQSFNDLRRIFVAQVGGKYSKSSVGPILISYEEFARIGPGIYAHRKQLRDREILTDALDRLLLNKSQCEIFCRSVWAGESQQLYLLWTAAAQVKWAEWCYDYYEEKLLASLLAVCKVDEWPIKAGDKSRWLRMQERLAYYTLEEPPVDLTERLPSFREFLAVAAHAAKEGRVSWLSTNRVTGYRVDDRHSVSLLALMIAGHIIEPAMHWQHEHKLAKDGEKLLHRFLISTEHQPPEKWPISLIGSMRTNYDSILEPGWTDSVAVHSLLDAIQQDALRDEEVDLRDSIDRDNYNQLKKQLKGQIILDNLRLRMAGKSKEYGS